MKRKLGSSNLEVSALGFGCWAIGGPFWSGTEALGWGEVDDKESIEALEYGIDMGLNFIDTADVYGAGHSERVISKVLKGKRDSLVLATKFGNVFDEETKQIVDHRADAAYIKAACEASLRRLETDYIDLYQFHLNDYPAEQAGEVLETLEQLVLEGKIRYYAWSTDFADRAEIFAKGKHCTAIQHEQNIFNDNETVLAICEAENLASINRGPLAMGLLTGKYSTQSSLGDKDVRGTNSPDWMRYFKGGKPNEEFTNKLENIREILTSDGRSLTQGALGWLWARSSNTLPIPGFRNVKQVKENAEAMQFGALSDVQMDQIKQLLAE
jgi:aryl-alcohol dehydrogenase-like predicted oxidoreductase